MNVIKIPEILIPKKSIDMYKWAVVACDQFTSQREYWDAVERLSENAYSTYHITYPEIYLNDNQEERIAKINRYIQKYIDDDIFDTIEDSFVLVVRTTKYGKTRLGLIISVDLDAYDYRPFTCAPIKATEGTIVERIPVRVKIRENASLELPHIMLLMDDAQKSIIEPLYEARNTLEVLYDTDLNMEGGHITGYRVDAAQVIERIYKLDNAESFLFAVGDGNHSLATAKACWDKIKITLSGEEKKNHKAKYALAELTNLYDDGLVFQPIHRVMINAPDFVEKLSAGMKGAGGITVFDKNAEYRIAVDINAAKAIRDVQDFIDGYIRENPGAVVDYIHGEEHLRSVAKSNNGTGLLMPVIEKSELFEYVVKNGVLPRKAFSMGEAEEKRYYLEAKKIK